MTREKCHNCGKYHSSACPYYCSRECCEKASAKSAAAHGLSENYDHMKEIEECCGGCVF